MARACPLETLLASPRRDRSAGGDAVVPVSERDASAYLDAIDARARRRVTLERRGAFHGEWAVIDGATLGCPKRTRPSARELKSRFSAAKPIVLPRIAADVVAEHVARIRARSELHERVQTAGGLRRWLRDEADVLEGAYEIVAARTSLFDRERDIERVRLLSLAPVGKRRIDDLWLESSWLSTHESDASLRLRFSFGREGDDDASRDVLRHRLVADLAMRLLPESAAIEVHPALAPLLQDLCGEAPLLTQTIAYWNAPNGGARFHHDAFGEDELDDGAFRQLGVCFVQLSGSTAWLALSLDDLAARVAEFAVLLAQGALPWVRAQLFEAQNRPFAGGFEAFSTLARDPLRLKRELALPSSGALGALVDRGPEFTAFLAEAGHAHVLEPGDAIVLPNFGRASTAMHSVFSASDETGYALSFALRPDRTAPEHLPGAARRARAARARGEGA